MKRTHEPNHGVIDGAEIFASADAQCLEDANLDDCSVEDLTKDLADELFELERVTLRINPALEADHALKVGRWEDQLLETEVSLRRARRKLSLLQGHVSEGDWVATGEELEAWRARLSLSERVHTRALVRHAAVIIDQGFDDAEELDCLYRELVWALHPTLHPNQTREELIEFGLAQLAYERGNVAKIKGLLADVRKHGHAPMVDDRELAQASLSFVRGEVADVKESFPYCLKGRLEDDAWVCRKEGELKERIVKASRELDECMAAQRNLVRQRTRSA